MVYTTLKQLPIRLGVSVIMVGTLVACGGGSETPTVVAPAVTLSAAQTAYETSALGTVYYSLGWKSPENNTLAVAPVNFFYATGNTLPASASTGSQTLTKSTINLTTLALPDFSQRGVVRHVVGGKIYARSQLDKSSISYSGDNVLANSLASDGVTVLSTTILSNLMTETLTGNVIDSPLMLVIGITPFATGNSNFDLAKPWLAGATSYKRTTQTVGDNLSVFDCTTLTTYDNNVNACTTTSTTLDSSFFPRTLTGVATKIEFADGTIKTIAGVRTWVANTANAKTTSYSPLGYRAYFEANGKIYLGTFTAGGSLYQAKSRSDATQTIDYDVRFNEAAINSIKTTLQF